VPKDLVHIIGTPQASNNFVSILIKANCFDKIFSIVPLSYYDNRITSNDDMIFFQGKPTKSTIKRIYYYILNSLKFVVKTKKNDSIWFYNLCTTNALAYILLKFIIFRKVYIIALDLDYPPINFLSIQNIIVSLLKMSNGVIFLSNRTILKHKKMLNIAGIIDKSKIQPLKIKNNKDFLFLFSGSLRPYTGFDMIIDVFKELPNCKLILTGLSNSEISSLSKFPNINYLGYLPYDKYLRLYDQVDICFSLRNPDFPENANNFPSKILEYFCYNKIVISTIKYPELDAFNYFSVEYSKDAIKKAILNICLMDKKDLYKYRDNQKNLISHFSAEKWIQGFKELECNHPACAE
jgi:glycosyltransferase involved in cell wall biosynthesis